MLQEVAQATAAMSTRDLIIQLSYLIASILFILGLRSLTRPNDARLGMQQAAGGMLFAVIGTLLNSNIITYQWIVIGLVVGAATIPPDGAYAISFSVKAPRSTWSR